MNKITLLLLSFSLLALSSFAQHNHELSPDGVIRCATMGVHEDHLANNPKAETLEEFETWLQEKMRIQHEVEAQWSRNGRNVLTIPVVVHVVHNGEPVGQGANISQAQVQSQIDVLNEDFRRMMGTPGFNNDPVGADTEIEFCLAQTDPSGNTMPEPGIDRVNGGQNTWGSNAIDNSLKPSTFWDPEQYFNMWTVNFSGGILGYAQFPSSSGLSGLNNNGGAANTDGVVIGYDYFGRVGNVSAPYDQGRTATHEVGHWLGLRHIWGDGGCSVDDFCNDTPDSDGANYNCNAVTSCGTSDMYENYMDYSEDACMNIFTDCQKTRMRTVLANSPRRINLVTNSQVCGVIQAAPVASFTSDQTAVCTGGSITFQDQSSFGPTSWSWTFQGGTPATSTQQNPTVTYSTPGTFTVTLTATNSFGNDAVTQNGYITVGSGAPDVIFFEGFEAGNLNNWNVLNPDNSTTWDVTNVGGTQTGSQAAFMDFYNYNAAGQYDAIVLSSPLDFSNHTDVTLTFDHAHRRYSQNESDSLLVYVSLDNGNSFIQVFGEGENGTGNFATNTTTTNDFVPASADDWCFGGTVGASCFSVDLSAYDGQSSVILAFEGYNDYGNNLYIDNIEVVGLCSGSSTGTAPTAAFAGNATTGCAPFTVNFSDLSAGAPTSWSWSFPGGSPNSSTSQNPSVTYSAPGTYNVSMTATNANGTNTSSQNNYITVETAPTAGFNATINGNDVTFADASTGGTSVSWDFGDGVGNSTQLSPLYSYTNAGTYIVSQTVTNACGSNTFTAEVTIGAASIEDELFAGGVSIYPNPNEGQFTLNIQDARVNEVKVGVLSLVGQRVFSRDFRLSGGDLNEMIDLGGIAAGTYLVELEADGRKFYQRVVVE